MAENTSIKRPQSCSHTSASRASKSCLIMLQSEPNWVPLSSQSRPSIHMTEQTQETAPKPPNEQFFARISGGLTLALVFLAASSFTWVYLSEVPAQTAAAAEALVSAPAPASLSDPDAFDGIS